MSDDNRNGHDAARLAEAAARAAAAGKDLSGMPGAAEQQMADTPGNLAGVAGASTGLAAKRARQAVAAASGKLRTAQQGLADGNSLEALRHLEHRARDYIRRNPLRSAGLAFAAGYVIAVLRRL
jgi:ElaB/YqjD/DUF883 family membrane-anchored ribosome-binding protein